MTYTCPEMHRKEQRDAWPTGKRKKMSGKERGGEREGERLVERLEERLRFWDIG